MADNELTMVIRFDVDPANQAALLDLMSESVGSVLRRQPGYLDGCILPSEDGSHILNITRWGSREDMEAVRQNPEAKAMAARMGEIAKPSPMAYPRTISFPAEG